MTAPPFADRLWLYGSCSIPAWLFYTLTCQPQRNLNDGTLVAIAVLQLIVPVAHNGQHGNMIDHSVIATLASYLVFGMIRYLVDRHHGKPTAPFYNVLELWNQRGGPQQKPQQEPMQETTSAMRVDAFRWLALAVSRVLLSMPVMAVLDGFLRVCNEPPLDPPYLAVLLAGRPVPMQTLYYYAVGSVALTMHLVLVPTFTLFFNSLKLCLRALIRPHMIQPQHAEMKDFVRRPPLFDRLWLATSVHDMWSRRWHQIFRWAFRDIAYTPVRQLFPSKPALGRALGAMAVFALSGLMHDYILLCMVGYRQYTTVPGLMGMQTMFFLLQGVATIVSNQHHVAKIPRPVARLMTFLFLLGSAPLFMEPYIRIQLNRIAWVPGYPRFLDPHLGPVCPYGPRLEVGAA